MTNSVKKITYANALEIAIASLEGEVKETAFTTEEVVEKLEALMESLNTKNRTKKEGPSKTSEENKKFFGDILGFMEEGKSYVVADILKGVPTFEGMSNQKVTAIVKLMLEANLVKVEKEKGRNRYSIVTE